MTVYLLPYVIFREAYLLGVADYVSLRPHARNWADCHVDGTRAVPNFAGC